MLTDKGRAALRGGRRRRNGALAPRSMFSRAKEPPPQGAIVNGVHINGEELRVWNELNKRGPGWETQAQFGPTGKSGSRRPDFLNRRLRLVIEHQGASFHKTDEQRVKDALKKAQYERLGYRVGYTNTSDLPHIAEKITMILAGGV